MSELSKVQEFIFSDKVQNTISDINNSLIDFNIIEITGMGNQEIKHSNILSWFFSNSEHELEYRILNDFLKKVAKENNQKQLTKYLYLSKHKQDITIYREEDDIDLLIVDKNNKIVITIENKVFAQERIDGDDGGQLKKYEEVIKDKYEDKDKDKDYELYFIFLTIDLQESSQGWLLASYQMIVDVLENILKSRELSIKTKILIESYIDMTKRIGMATDNKLKELCREIWENEEYKEAIEILIKNRPDKADEIKDKIKKFAKKFEDRKTGESYNFFMKFHDKSPLTYMIQYSGKTRKIQYTIVQKKDDDRQLPDDKICINSKTGFSLSKDRNENFREGYRQLSSSDIFICSDDNLELLEEWLEKVKKVDEDYFSKALSS